MIWGGFTSRSPLCINEYLLRSLSLLSRPLLPKRVLLASLVKPRSAIFQCLAIFPFRKHVAFPSTPTVRDRREKSGARVCSGVPAIHGKQPSRAVRPSAVARQVVRIPSAVVAPQFVCSVVSCRSLISRPIGFDFRERRPRREWLQRDAGMSSFSNGTSKAIRGWHTTPTPAVMRPGYTHDRCADTRS